MNRILRARRGTILFRMLIGGATLVMLGLGQASRGADTTNAQDAPPASTVAKVQPAPVAGSAPAKEPPIYLLARWPSFAVAMLFLVVVLALTIAVKSKEGINFFQSPDGAVSVSKVQVWMWTMTILFSYVYLFLWHGPPDKFPDSLWELMGISALSSGAAKYIAMVAGKPSEPTQDVKEKIKNQNWLASMLSDDGQPSMMRLQMFGWTLVTVFLFLMYLHKEQELWDVPKTLVILMGISHAGYLGDKGAAAARPN